MQIRSLTRRGAVLAASAIALAALYSTPVAVQAQSKNVKIAVIVPAVGPLGAPGNAGQVRCRDRHQRNQRGGRHQGARRREARAGRDRRRRLGREGKERRAASGGAGAGRGRRHGRVALHVHARRDRSDRARANPVADPVLFGHDHRSRLQIRVPELPDGWRAINQRGADNSRAREGGDRQGANYRRHHRRQHCLTGELSQADARGRARKSSASRP